MQEAAMGAPRNTETFGLEDGEYCPECCHDWTLNGPAHFTDCRYFSLDDDRDEEPPVPQWVTRRQMVTGELEKAAT